MSWSFSGIGKPAALKAGIDRELQNYGPGQSRDEFEGAATHLKGLLNAAHDHALVRVEASGSAGFVDGKRISANVAVSIVQLRDPFYE